MTKEELKLKVKELGIDLTDEKLDKLEEFYQILIKENETMNLTRIIEKEEVYLKHFYDSLTLARVIDLNEELTLCDVGTGAGFPGIVLKIVFPNLKITLIDALQKRVNYLNKTIESLDLKDIVAYHKRSEDFARDNREKFDIVTARAVANLKVLSELTIPLVKVNGYFVAMKANLDEELEDANKMITTLGGKIEQINKFNLPKEEANRTLVKIKKIKETAKQYPRTIDKIKKANK